MRKRTKRGIDIQSYPDLKLCGLRNYKEIDVFQPTQVAIPVQQHIGDPAVIIVEVGEYVFLGQIIARVNQGLGSHVHSSVSGTVIGIEERDQGQSKMVLCVIIENDGKDRMLGTFCPTNIENLTADIIVRRVKEAGVVGLGGATFPTHVKLSPKENIHTCIFNGAECEPLIMADAALMVNQGEKLVQGCLLVLKAVGAQVGVIGIESDKKEAIAIMSELCRDVDNLSVLELVSSYPQGSTEMLVVAATGEEIPVGKSSRDMGILVMNVATTVAVYEASVFGQSLSHRICSVVGDVGMPKNIYFPLGTIVRDVIDYCGGFSGTPSKVIVGGFMMGKTITTLETSLTKASNGLIVINEAHDQHTDSSPCIRCARCVGICPMGLLPYRLESAFLKEDYRSLKKLYVEICNNCGCCTYICPARRKLAEHITKGKRMVTKYREE